MNDAAKKAAFVQQFSSHQDVGFREGSRDAERCPSVPRSRYSDRTGLDEDIKPPTPEPSRQRRRFRSPLSSAVIASLSREASPPLIEPSAGFAKDDAPQKVGVKDVQVECIDQTPWHEYEIPGELELLQPDMPEEIRNIIQESIDEQRAMRSSKMQVPAVVARKTIAWDQGEPENGEPVVAESSAMAAKRHAASSASSLGTTSVDLSLNSATSLGSSNAANDVLKPTVSGEGPRWRSCGESQLPLLSLANGKLQKNREKLPKAHGLFKMLRRPKDAKRLAAIEHEPETYECTSCFDEIQSKEAIGVPCQHRYCTPCFSQLIATAIQNEAHFPPKCCLQEIPRGVLRNHLGPKELALFDNKALEYSVAFGSRYYCARPECAKWIDITKARAQNGTLECPHCSYSMCTFCRGPVHAADHDCPQDLGLNETLQQAERAGWQRCYNCRALVELNTGCRHITCKCRAEFCYTCGARWRSCACTEDDQSRRAQQIRENLNKLEAEARAEEEEIRAAIAAVEEAERQAAEERAEEERRQEELRVEETRLMTLRESERVEKINRHFKLLRGALESVRVAQSHALGQRHSEQTREVEAKATALETTAQKRDDDMEAERARIIDSTNSKIQESRKKHAMELVQTRSRHRKDEDECVFRITERESLQEEGQGAPDAATILETLFSAQELERSALRAMQAREIEKYGKRGALYLRILDEQVQRGGEERRARYEGGRREIVEEVREMKRRQWAEWRWVDVLGWERTRMLGEDERRVVGSGGEVGG
ncbi:MAG: hypothetical protein LQ338_002987 [Usnochroma carphineum]|nr:MAG: hypothetical protein LQ338_002987 [Usnochroma carphineum]